MNEKNYMDSLTLGVYVLGVKKEEKINFMTAAWVTQISAKPNKILVAVGESHYTAELIRQSGAFSVNVLGEGQEWLALKCGTVSGRRADKTAGVSFRMLEGVPVIDDTAAYIRCKVEKEIHDGDHVLFIGVVEDGKTLGKKPLAYEPERYLG